MTTITPSPIRDPRRAQRAFTLVEIMIGATLSSFILLAVLTTFLFMGRSGVNVQNYADMESQSRRALETFAEDVRQASAITWTTNQNITLTVNGASVTYAYSSGAKTFSRTAGGTTRTLITGITANTFTFRAFNIAGTELALATAANLSAANSSTKQLQISLECMRSNVTAVAVTNTVLSARFILRNKVVTA